MLLAAQLLQHLLGALEAEEQPADDQQEGDRLRQELAEQQRDRQQDQQLVAQAALGDRQDHRQLAVGREIGDVGRRYRGVVDHHPRRLAPRLRGGGGDIVERCGRRAGDQRDVIEQRDKSGRQCKPPRHDDGASRRTIAGGGCRMRKSAASRDTRDGFAFGDALRAPIGYIRYHNVAESI
jgi:hypothetical protein